MSTSLALVQEQYDALRAHLLPADGLEAAAIILCGLSSDGKRLSAHKVIPIAYARCQRTKTSITWPTAAIESALAEAANNDLAVVKIHSHRVDYSDFSPTDDRADAELFPSLHGWFDKDLPHSSAIMLESGEIYARTYRSDGTILEAEKVLVFGDDIRVFTRREFTAEDAPAALRTIQAFGEGTYGILKLLKIAVVGCSGTGSYVVEQLGRLGVGELLLVDPDTVERKNLNRIANSKLEHADRSELKVNALRDAVEKMGTGTKVSALPLYADQPEAINAIGNCDLAFGCMDSIDGRHFLNRIATFYSLPYFDLGVRLDADGKGGVNSICGSVHYIQAGMSTLLSRGLFTPADLSAARLRRENPAEFQAQEKEGYVRGANVDRPAVISVNLLFSAFALNDFLARIHGYRFDPNGLYAQTTMNLCDMCIYPTAENEFPSYKPWKRFVGKGTTQPLLGSAFL